MLYTTHTTQQETVKVLKVRNNITRQNIYWMVHSNGVCVFHGAKEPTAIQITDFAKQWDMFEQEWHHLENTEES